MIPGRAWTDEEFAVLFWATVFKTSTCWLWAGGRSRGYGMVRWRGEHIGAHVAAYRLTRGPVPEGMEVCHTCDVRRCVRPDHLFPGTRSDNMVDMVTKGRDVNTPKTHCPRGHPYSGDNLSRNGRRRRCLACHRDREARRRRSPSP